MVWFEASPSRRELRGHLWWFASWAAVTLIAAILRPDPAGHGTHQQLGLPPCPSVILFGRPCPGCGLTTGFSHVVHGHFAEAMHVHPFAIALYGMYTLSAFACLGGYIFNRRFNTESMAFSRFLTALTVVFFAYGLVRFCTTRAALVWPSSTVWQSQAKSTP